MIKWERATIDLDNGTILTLSDHRLINRGSHATTIEDPAVKTQMEGGYKATRPGHSRNNLRRTFQLGLKEVPHADYEILHQLWQEVLGGSIAFRWFNHFHPDYDPDDDLATRMGFSHVVRFASQFNATTAKIPGDMTFWNITDIRLEQV